MRAAESRGTQHVHGCLLATGCPRPYREHRWPCPPLAHPLTCSLELRFFGLTLPFYSAVSAAHDQLLRGARTNRSQAGANPTADGAGPDANTQPTPSRELRARGFAPGLSMFWLPPSPDAPRIPFPQQASTQTHFRTCGALPSVPLRERVSALLLSLKTQAP